MRNISNLFTALQLQGFNVEKCTLSKQDRGFEPIIPFPHWVKDPFFVVLTRRWDKVENITLLKDKDGLRFKKMPKKTTRTTVDGKRVSKQSDISMKELDAMIEAEGVEAVIAKLL